MSKMASLPASTRRSFVAVVVVAAVVFGPAIVDRALASMPQQISSDVPAGLAKEGPAASDDVLEAAVDLVDSPLADVPPQYAAEIGMPAGVRDVRVSSDGAVVGYVVEGAADEVAKEVDACFTARGWISVSLGGIEGRTYLKQEGCYTWALMTATQVGDSTSVVVRCQRR